MGEVRFSVLCGRGRFASRARQALAFVVATAGAIVFLGAGPATATTLDVCAHGCPYSQLSAAVGAASNGDVIRVAPGTYTGGITVDVSVTILGAGAGGTIISGGGPVLTIGSFGAASEPTVDIEGVTISNGVTQDSPLSIPFTGIAGTYAAGGGIEIPPSVDLATDRPKPGATVSIADSVITGNRVAPTSVADSTLPCPGLFPGLFPDGDCPFAAAYGGGIDSWGNLAVTNSTVRDNLVGTASGLSALASDAAGAGIFSQFGSLTVTNSVIRNNSATASGPDGRFADTGGVFAEGSTFAMTNSQVSGNTTRLDASLPDSVPSSEGGPPFAAIAGGVHLSGNVSATLRNSVVSANSVTMTNSVGSAAADSGGIHMDVIAPLSNDVISDNTVTSLTLPGSTGNAGGDSGAGELSGTITNSQLTGNRVTVTSVAGGVNAGPGGTIFAGTLTNDTISGNMVEGDSSAGPAQVGGGGLLAGGDMTLRNTTVSGNTASVNGAPALAVGGGILDTPIPNGGPPGGALDLVNSRVLGNQLVGGPSATLIGGGIFAAGEPVTITNSKIAGNVPDQCFGC